ncbi:3-keto-5-aminohexanoate cleavage protein [Actinoplanes sp. NPDC049316]|uniref:3-keto-5-aminohexanoate cleavage protein n=1 Tax=Actinoplanes sp. NPDC049316 TaxID=3154727 RepID=UPI00343C7131
MIRRIKVCLNGGRRPEEHEGVPVTPGQLAAAAAAAVAAGAVHLHPRDASGAGAGPPLSWAPGRRDTGQVVQGDAFAAGAVRRRGHVRGEGPAEIHDLTGTRAAAEVTARRGNGAGPGSPR